MPEYDVVCKTEGCDYHCIFTCGMTETDMINEAECPMCGNQTLRQDYTKKNIVDIWNCSGSTRQEKYAKAPLGSQDKLDSELWKNDAYRAGKHIPEKFKKADDKAKETAIKMGYKGDV